MRVLNKKYWPVSIRVDSDMTSKMCIWCRQQTGIEYGDWIVHESGTGDVFAFKHEDTALIFKLKWGGYIK